VTAYFEAVEQVELPFQFSATGIERSRLKLERFYTTLNTNVRAFIEGLAVWDQLDATQQGQAQAALNRVPPMARRGCSPVPTHGRCTVPATTTKPQSWPGRAVSAPRLPGSRPLAGPDRLC
jgi:hypothetical protein